MKLFTLPNLFTLANLFSGSLACIFLLYNFPPNVLIWFLVASLVFDFFDGFVARFTQTNSELGVQLDSLADMISFGFFPSLVMMKLLGLDSEVITTKYYAIFGISVVLFSALRLAKFNIDKEQTYYFKGLPTPANTILIFSVYWIIVKDKVVILDNNYFLLALAALCCWLLISNIPLFALKFKGFAWKNNQIKYIFLLISLTLILVFQAKAIIIIIAIYILISIIFRKKILQGKL